MNCSDCSSVFTKGNARLVGLELPCFISSVLQLFLSSLESVLCPGALVQVEPSEAAAFQLCAPLQMTSASTGAALAVSLSFCTLKGVVFMDLLKSTAEHSAHELSSLSSLIHCYLKFSGWLINWAALNFFLDVAWINQTFSVRNCNLKEKHAKLTNPVYILRAGFLGVQSSIKEDLRSQLEFPWHEIAGSQCSLSYSTSAQPQHCKQV